jgi:hypothetical protein
VLKIDPEIMHGKLCFSGTRVPVTIFLANLVDGARLARFLRRVAVTACSRSRAKTTDRNLPRSGPPPNFWTSGQRASSVKPWHCRQGVLVGKSQQPPNHPACVGYIHLDLRNIILICVSLGRFVVIAPRL